VLSQLSRQHAFSIPYNRSCKLVAHLMSIIPGFEDFSQKLHNVLKTEAWQECQRQFSSCQRILLVGNGGNLAVCDHGAIDIARLTNKSATAPGSGILASSLINDASHDLWVKNWLSISCRGLTPSLLEKTMLIGVTSSGYSKNICVALEHALALGCKASLISALEPKISGTYNVVKLHVNEYHTSEVLTLSLIYQLIHASGFTCPTITESNTRKLVSDYTMA
jgi:DNA-binding MurR/RpiR family transcriptional regulator